MKKHKMLKIDPYLCPYEADIDLRMSNYKKKRSEILGDCESIVDFASGYKYFGVHKTADGWVYREWAPGADEMYFTGDFCNWDIYAYHMDKLENGVFEIKLPENVLKLGHYIQAIIIRSGQVLRRVPTYATRVLQDKETNLWCAVVNDTLFDGFEWTDGNFKPKKTPYIYECHIGMAQEKYGIGTYKEFTENILPRIRSLGYNTIQIMAVMEHPYYASFGYQVSNFFAPSSRYGSPRDLKELVNTAHSMGITVLLDLVHSHAVKNVGEGLNLFDGTEYQFFREGGRGNHSAWDTKLFDYGKNEVLHFLLSNLRYWLETYHFDGFRFDGVTSMLYHDHGLGSAFCNYDTYFSVNTDTEAITYLQLANELVHTLNPRAITVAEDMSGMPGMCLKINDGGIGFDYRLSMGVPDMWIKLLKDIPDDKWNMDGLWHELTTRRPLEKNIGYCESHDQALVGDKTIMFRLCDAEMYSSMRKDSRSLIIDRGMALHKMIRFITSVLAGEGYLNFMGNEFGHPEWIDFPREGNGWSYHYCRRQWSLDDNPELRYRYLSEFDRTMISYLKKKRLSSKIPELRHIHNDDKVIVFAKGDSVFAFNFDPNRSYERYFIKTDKTGNYKAAFSTDDAVFGGFGRIDADREYEAVVQGDGRIGFMCYLPSRTAAVFEPIKK